MGVSPETGLRSTFIALVLIGFFARLSYGMARTPLLALFAKTLGATPAFRPWPSSSCSSPRSLSHRSPRLFLRFLPEESGRFLDFHIW